ncbi:DNA primase catalytic subunit PriS [Thermococcus thioreducens]|uniref:DNA primase small subunit PriS n=1 Tax=Thermococcus thioreducens TaxID=277988 RepID=A0A0Q2M1F7_9EURY|nr:DNA primase catalytic subunit PriS [Thermococcus thioreducens]ASJ11525.1 DNA primase [Thermococcus thioreducens]KQH81865.1 DNA primase [Thermococcus thioreducens]SEW05136.1 DNA primase small subunit [Thermococcus thioreducens]
MAELFREVTERERKHYYSKEWSAKKLPEFIVRTLEEREFGFDHTGEGPNDRKNVFMDVRDLEDYVRATAPYAIYSSVALYEEPKDMSGWLGAELVFDIDAKDLPLRRCAHLHEHGQVCPICLEDAKELARDTLIILKEDFGFENVHVVYSGRGYHIRVLDEWALRLDGKAREKILAYISAAEELNYKRDIDSNMIMLSSGYYRVFRLRFGYFIKRISKSHLENFGLSPRQIQDTIENKEKIYQEFVLNAKSPNVSFPSSLKRPPRKGKKRSGLMILLNASSTFSKAYFDGRVTVDVKRILRLPSSLHSKVGLIATYIGPSEKKLERFNPFKDAVPGFRKEEVREAYEEWVEEHGDEM